MATDCLAVCELVSFVEPVVLSAVAHGLICDEESAGGGIKLVEERTQDVIRRAQIDVKSSACFSVEVRVDRHGGKCKRRVETLSLL